MKISVRVKPNAKKNVIEQLDSTHYRVSVAAPPVDNKANEKVIELLAVFLGKPKRSLTIVKGTASKDKVVEVV